MIKKKNPEDVIKSLRMMVFVLGFCVVVLSCGVVSLHRESQVAPVVSVVEFAGEEEVCELVHEAKLDSEGFCPINNWREDYDYVHYVDCSWGKQKIYSSDEKVSWSDRLTFVYLECDYIKSEKVII